MLRNFHLLKISKQRKPLQTHYYIGSSKLEEVQHNPYLGVELTSDLTWKTHTSNISGRANRILNLLRRHLSWCNREVKTRAFTTLVRPHLEYSSTGLDPYYKQDTQSLEKIQRKGAGRFELASFGTPTQKQKTNDLLQHMQQLRTVTLPDYVKTSNSQTRSHDQSYIQIQTNYEQYKNSFLPRTIREWNSLPPDLVHAESVDVFSKRLQTLTA